MSDRIKEKIESAKDKIDQAKDRKEQVKEKKVLFTEKINRMKGELGKLTKNEKS